MRKTAKPPQQAPLKPRYRDIEMKIPDWVRDIEDSCLRTMLFEVFTMQFYALDRGHSPHGKVMGSVNKTLERIQHVHWNQTPAENWGAALIDYEKC